MLLIKFHVDPLKHRFLIFYRVVDFLIVGHICARKKGTSLLFFLQMPQASHLVHIHNVTGHPKSGTLLFIEFLILYILKHYM